LKPRFCLLVCSATLANVALANDTSAGQCQDPPAYLVSAADALIARSPRITLAVHKPFDAPAEGDETSGARPIDREREIEKATETGSQPERYLTTMALAKFTVLENIKGDGPEEFYLAHSPQDLAASRNDFDNHEDNAFWSDPKAGRITLNPDCTPVPAFAENATYLIFTGQPHVKAYERINDPDDAWLAYVRETVAAD